MSMQTRSVTMEGGKNWHPANSFNPDKTEKENSLTSTEHVTLFFSSLT